MAARFRQIELASKLIAVCVLALLPFAVLGALSVPTGNASVHDWLPKSRPERVAYDSFVENFGGDQFILVSWEGANITDARLQKLVEELRKADAELPSPLFERFITTSSVLTQLTQPPLALSSKEALSRLRGTLLGEDGTGCVVVSLTKMGVEASANTIELVEHVARHKVGIAADELYLVGTLFEEVTVDRASAQTLRWLVPPSTLAAILVAILSLGKVRECVIVFALAGVGQLLTVGLLYVTGGEFSAVLIVLPTLVFMLCLSSAVHLMNYYHDVAEQYADHRGARTLLLGFRPCALAAITTIIGMSSLAVSELTPVRQFGLYAACSLAVATSVLLLSFPVLADLLIRSRQPERASLSDAIAVSEHTGLLAITIQALAAFVKLRALWISLIGIVALVAAACGISQLRASTKFDRMFPKQSPAISSMHWVEQHLGPIVSIEVLLSFDDNQADLLQRLRWVTTVQRSLREMPSVGGTLSAASFAPEIPSSRGTRASAQRSIFAAKLREQIPELEHDGWIAEYDTLQTWRITCKVTSLAEDYGFFTRRVEDCVSQTLAKYSEQPGAPSTVTITGLSPVVHEAQLMLLSDLGNSFLMAFVLITPVMMLITRSFALGALVMLPNVLPVGIVFGLMGWLDVPLDIAGILTASIALGIAVDDTLHFVSWYSRSRRLGMGVLDSIGVSYRRCAVAMFETTLICCSAMLPFLFSDFVPTAHFATLMVLMLCGAIVGDLVFLPALLITYERLRRGEFLQANSR